MHFPKSIQTVYLIGIAGTGMGAFAGLLKQAGYRVCGSDSNIYPPMSDKLRDWGIEVMTPYSAGNLALKPDLVIVGNVIRRDNEEATWAREQGMLCASFPQALRALFLEQSESIVVTGTHGKTTSSAILAHTLRKAGFTPNFLIGGIPKNFEESFSFTKSDRQLPFVIEGDEYDTAYFDKGPKFLHYCPKLLLCTSLEYDHADIYENVDQIRARFSELVALVPAEGQIVACAQAPHLLDAIKVGKPKAEVSYYGKGGDYVPEQVRDDESGLSFQVVFRGISLGSVKISLSGNHNLENTLGCYAILHKKGLSHEQIALGFATFAGVKRRLEEVGEAAGILVIDDFAHHPTAVKTTIQATKRKYPGRPIWAIFEPRSASSCRDVFQAAYAESFSEADRLLLAPPGRKLEQHMIDVSRLALDVACLGTRAEAADSIDGIVDVVVREAKPKTVLLCMSNGSFGNIHKKILEQLSGANLALTK